MAESLAAFLVEQFSSHTTEAAYKQKRGYRMKSFVYGDVFRLAIQFAAELERRHIAKNDRVMLWAENSAEWVAAFFGCVLRGVVAVPMDDAASPDFASRVFEQVRAELLVTSRQHEQQSSRLKARSVLILEDLSNLPEASYDALSRVAIARDDPLEIVFTSGTTAEPRGVVITHGNVLANVTPLQREMHRYFKYERFVHPVRFLNLLPLSHVFGQFLGMFLPPLLHGTVVFQQEMKASDVIHTIKRERISVLVSVPRLLQAMKQKVERDLEDQHDIEAFRKRFIQAKDKHFLRRWWMFRRIRRQFGWKFWAFISGGATLDNETEEFWGRLGYAVIQGYGLTETTSLISVNHPFHLGKGSIGKVIPGREVKLAPDGEILVRGGGVASGYWDSSGAHTVSDAEGWYRTGDIGALDEAGNLYFKGRKKEVIVTPAGTNVYPEDLEDVLRRQPETKDCVVIGVERGGNAEPCAVVIVRDHSDAAAVVQRANQSLAEYQRMRLWMEWPEEDFPRTSTQKPKRNVIAARLARALSERSPGVDNHKEAAAESPLANLISRISGRAAPVLHSEVTLDSDLGLSSLDRVELMSALEDRYQVDLSEARFNAVKTVGDLERILRGEAEPGAGCHYPGWTLGWPITWIRLLTHYLLLRPAVFLLGWPCIAGRENLRGVKGPLLVIANHIGDVDPGFILTALPARFRHHLAIGAGGEALEKLRLPPPDRGFFRGIYDRLQWALGVCLLNLFPLPREAGFRRSFAYAGEAVDRGYSVLVFPEGRHTTTGDLNPFRSGIGLLAHNLGIPVLPMRIDGLYEVKQSGKKFAAPHKITVRIGKPIQFAADADPEVIASRLYETVKAL